MDARQGHWLFSWSFIPPDLPITTPWFSFGTHHLPMCVIPWNFWLSPYWWGRDPWFRAWGSWIWYGRDEITSILLFIQSHSLEEEDAAGHTGSWGRGGLEPGLGNSMSMKGPQEADFVDEEGEVCLWRASVWLDYVNHVTTREVTPTLRDRQNCPSVLDEGGCLCAGMVRIWV